MDNSGWFWGFFAVMANTSLDLFQGFFSDCHTGPELNASETLATFSSKVSETAEFQHCEIKSY